MFLSIFSLYNANNMALLFPNPLSLNRTCNTDVTRFTENMIKGLDDDEVEFLDLVDRTKLEEERRKSVEEAREMKDFRDAVATLHERSLVQRIHTEIHSRPSTQSGISR
jgi:hypothetical protein